MLKHFETAKKMDGSQEGGSKGLFRATELCFMLPSISCCFIFLSPFSISTVQWSSVWIISSYFWFQYTHVQSLPTCPCITIATSEVLFLPFSSLSVISRQLQPAAHSFSHRKTLISILTPGMEDAVDVAAPMILQVLCSALAAWSWSCGQVFWKLFPRWQHFDITSSLKHLVFQSKSFCPPCRPSILHSCGLPVQCHLLLSVSCIL